MASTKYESVRLECSDNGGYILSFEEISQPTGNSSEMCNRQYSYKKEVFTESEGDKAVARMKEISGKEESESGSAKVEIEVKMPE